MEEGLLNDIPAALLPLRNKGAPIISGRLFELILRSYSISLVHFSFNSVKRFEEPVRCDSWFE